MKAVALMDARIPTTACSTEDPYQNHNQLSNICRTNGKTREGNILVDSGRKEFVRALGLQSSVVKRSLRATVEEQSYVNGNEPYPVEAHEIDHSFINVPALDCLTISVILSLPTSAVQLI